MFYNDNDPKVCAWLRELIAQGHLPQGEVSEQSITEIEPSQCQPTSHFFAGIGGWAYALKLAGWPEDRPVWTGSCPCQPFSVAGKGRGEADERHLWPAFRRLISECRPPTVFGEQVASKAGRLWLAGVRADLEAMGYAVGAADLCAAGLGAPHIRQRLYWVADANGRHTSAEGLQRSGEHGQQTQNSRIARGLADAEDWRRPRQGRTLGPERSSGLGNAEQPGLEGHARHGENGDESGRIDTLAHGSAWTPSVSIPCADGKARRIGPGITPLAHGIPARVVRLRGYGNAIVPQVAAEFIRAFLDAARPDPAEPGNLLQRSGY